MATQIRPQKGPQERFLATPADIAIFGGAAGGGKTYGLLLEALRHIDNPNYGATILRRTFPQITQEGGMWDASQTIYPLIGGVPRESRLDWVFPSGASVRFAHMQYESDRFNYQGAQIPLIEFDELTQFTAQQFWYLLSRNRSTCGVRPYIRAATNPDPDSFVAGLVAWWVDPATGYAIPERSGVLRWFVRAGDDLRWFDSAAAARAAFPELAPKSLTFIPAKIEDNPALMRADPGYMANLMALPYVDRARLKEGNWIIRPAAGKVFNRGWFQIVDAVPTGGVRLRFWDLAATEKEQKGQDPDYTAGVLMLYKDGIACVLDCIDVQAGPAESDRIILNVSHQDVTEARATSSEYRVRWEIQPGEAGKKETVALVKMLVGLDARGVRPQGDKLVRAKPLASYAEAGNVKLLHGAWNERWLQHMHMVPDGSHDDIMDASAGAFTALAGPKGVLLA